MSNRNRGSFFIFCGLLESLFVNTSSPLADDNRITLPCSRKNKTKAVFLVFVEHRFCGASGRGLGWRLRGFLIRRCYGWRFERNTLPCPEVKWRIGQLYRCRSSLTLTKRCCNAAAAEEWVDSIGFVRFSFGRTC